MPLKFTPEHIGWHKPLVARRETSEVWMIGQGGGLCTLSCNRILDYQTNETEAKK
jgi:hypothetical protein